MTAVKGKCGTCGRMVSPWRFTVYLHAHKHNGDWCPGGNITPAKQDTRSICFCTRNPLGHTLRQHAELWPMTFETETR